MVKGSHSGADPHVTEIAWVEPLAVFREASGRELRRHGADASLEGPPLQAGLVWLDSGGAPDPPARWSVLALAPREVLEVRVGAGRLAPGSPDPFAALQELHDRWRARLAPSASRTIAVDGSDPTATAAAREGIPGDVFTGGVIALVGYDAGRALEKIPALATDDASLPDLWAGVYDAALVFDRSRRRAFVTQWGGQGKRTGSEAARALEELGRAAAGGSDSAVRTDVYAVAEADPKALAKPPIEKPARVPASAGREAFLAGVARIREEIARGEIYQANLTRRIVAEAPFSSAPALYERLREASPTPFGAYVDAGSFRLLSASPERFVRVSGGLVETRPIKGTRPRGRNPGEDEALRAELLASAKDAAELLMIVDLERNDLGRVGVTGSVTVDGLPTVEGYSSVWHMVATVRARLRPGIVPADVLRASFPGGSITGAPKLRAMEILETLEPSRRKFSMGSLVAWDFGGDWDSSILIRTMTMRAGEVVLDVGAGIVADSSPEAEFLETLAKAAPLVAALEGA